MTQAEDETASTMMDHPDIDSESYVDLTETERQHNGAKAITLTLKPQNESIGMKSNKTSTLICATTAACSLPEGIDRTPVDIVVALDVSGSMQGDKLSLCKRTIKELLRNLLPRDRFGLITYSDNAEITEHIRYMTVENKSKVLSTVNKLHVRGSTNISDAIGLSFQELRSVSSPNTIRSIFLLTDGHANVGITESSKLLELTRKCWKGLEITDEHVVDSESSDRPGRGILDFLLPKKEASVQLQKEIVISNSDLAPASLICFGFGDDHNASMLRDISEATETGSYYYVQKDSDVSSAFGDALGGLVSVVAQSVVLNILPPSNDIEILRVHHDRAIRRDDETAPSESTFTVSLGDFYAEETRDILIEVSLSNTGIDEESTSICTPIPHLSALLSYTDTIQNMPFRSTKPVICFIERPVSTAVVSLPDDYVTKQWIRVRAANAMEEAEKLGHIGKFDEATNYLNEAKALIVASSHDIQNDEMIKQLLSDLELSLNGFTSRQMYYTSGSKNIVRSRQAYKHQRAAVSDTASNIVYRGRHKEVMAQHFHASVAEKSEGDDAM